MIFSKNIYKLSSGKNLTLYIEDNKIYFYVFNKLTKKYQINFDSNAKTTLLDNELSYNQITKLNTNQSCVFYDKNISIVDNEEQNI